MTKRRYLRLTGQLALLVAFALLVLSLLCALSNWPLSGLVVAAVAAAGIGVFLWSLGSTGNRRRAGLRAGGLVAILAGLFLFSGGVLYGLGRETEPPFPFLVFGIILPLVGAALLGRASSSEPGPGENDNARPEMWPRYVGIILPALVNYGFLLANDDRPSWRFLVASLVLLVDCMVWLAARRDWRGVLWIAVLYVPINAWPIVLNIIGPLGDQSATTQPVPKTAPRRTLS